MASVTANVELTTCGHTASCGDRRGDSSQSTVISHLEAVQLDAAGQLCNVTRSSNRTDVIDVIPHHYNIAYSLPSVPVLAVCGGSRKFLVRVYMEWVSGNVVKVDGSAPDPLAMTNAFMINSYYAPTTTTVPSVIGLSQAAAQNALTAAHLNLGKVTITRNSAPAGTVVDQNAPRGTVEPTNSPVNIKVSNGIPLVVLFTGEATASKPESALSLAASRARSKATQGGFSLDDCTDDSTVGPNPIGTYDASVILTCIN